MGETSAPPVKKACDACHRRKVRCTGGQPCKNCGQASLQCTYLAIPQKKGPKGSRAKVISEIRDRQMVKSPTTSKDSHDAELNPFDFNTSPISPDLTRSSDLSTSHMVDSCISFFFSHLYPTMPIFSRDRLAELARTNRDTSLEEQCVVLGLCAFVIIQPGVTIGDFPIAIDEAEADDRKQHGILLLDEIRRLRKCFDHVESPTLLSVQTSFFMFSSYFCLDKPNQMYYYMRETSTLAHIIGMGEESNYRSGDPENMYKRRLYWLILATERAYAIERHKPISLYATIELPTVSEDPQEAPVMEGFLHMVRLFRLIDDEFMSIWNKAKSECSTAWLADLQRQLIDAVPPHLECTDNQAADVRVTQHWLRTMVWQLSIANGCLSSTSPDAAMTFTYPIEIARDLVKDMQKSSQHSMEVHGIGFIEKLFDIACTLTDVIACVLPLDRESALPAESPAEHLNALLNIISRLRGGTSRYQPLLVAKVHENLPTLSAFSDLPSHQRTHFPSKMIPHISATSPNTSLAANMSQLQSPALYTPQSPFSERQRGLMFDAYSPSMSHISDMPVTPVTPTNGTGSPMGMGGPGHMMGLHMPAPRSVPAINDVSIKYEGFPT